MKTINIFVNSFPKTSETFIFNKVLMLLKNGFNYYLALGASCTGIILVTLIIQKYFLH